MEGELWPLAEVHQARRMVQVSTIVFLKKPTNTLLLTLLLYFTTQHLDAKGGGGAGHRERDAHQSTEAGSGMRYCCLNMLFKYIYFDRFLLLYV